MSFLFAVALSYSRITVICKYPGQFRKIKFTKCLLHLAQKAYEILIGCVYIFNFYFMTIRKKQHKEQVFLFNLIVIAKS